MLNFDFLEKALKIFPHHILHMIFQEKCFSCDILLTDQISLSQLGNMCIAVVYFPGCDVKNFEISLIKPFFYMTKKSRQNFEYLENKSSRVFICQKLSQT